MASGIATGFVNGSSNMRQQVNAEIDRLVREAQARLRIESPSKVFAEIGGQMAAGLGVGFADEIRDVQRTVREAINSIIPTAYATGTKAQTEASGGFHLTQEIYAAEMSYFEMQRQAGRQFKLIAREVGAI